VQTELVENLARLGIFRDLTPSELADVAATWQTATFREGQRIISAGQENTSFYIIVEGEAAVFIGDEQRSLLVRGSFFGEVSALLGEPATADIMTRSPLRCLVVPAAELEHFLVSNPRIMFRVLQTEARRLQGADDALRTRMTQ
jgi:CRP/FNR family cyclic AMP-dependent transcriptional regulator